MSSLNSKENNKDANDELSENEEQAHKQEYLTLEQSQPRNIYYNHNNNNNSSNNENDNQRFVTLAAGTHITATETETEYETETDIRNNCKTFEITLKQQESDKMPIANVITTTTTTISSYNISKNVNAVQFDDNEDVSNAAEIQQEQDYLPSIATTTNVNCPTLTVNDYYVTVMKSLNAQCSIENEQQQRQQQQLESPSLPAQPYSKIAAEKIYELFDRVTVQEQEQLQQLPQINESTSNSGIESPTSFCNKPSKLTVSTQMDNEQKEHLQEQRKHQFFQQQQQQNVQQTSSNTSLMNVTRTIIIPINNENSPTASLMRRPPLRYRMLHIFSDTLQFLRCPSFAKDCCIILIMYMGFTLLIFLFTLLSYSFLRSTVASTRHGLNQTFCPL